MHLAATTYTECTWTPCSNGLCCTDLSLSAGLYVHAKLLQLEWHNWLHNSHFPSCWCISVLSMSSSLDKPLWLFDIHILTCICCYWNICRPTVYILISRVCRQNIVYVQHAVMQSCCPLVKVSQPVVNNVQWQKSAGHCHYKWDLHYPTSAALLQVCWYLVVVAS